METSEVWLGTADADAGDLDWGGRDIRVLLVEDNPINRRIAAEHLKAPGLSVGYADSGESALSQLAERHYDAVFMDVQMPGMDGYEATRRIREIPGLADLPVIAMTAHAASGNREKCLAAGMNDYLAKPVEADQLLATLARWLSAATGSSAERPPRFPKVGAVREPPPRKSSRADPPGLDVAAGVNRMMGQRDRYINLLRRFVTDYGDVADRIAEALAAGDIDSARQRLHTLKGLAANLSAVDLLDAVTALHEQVKRGGTSEEREPLVVSLSREMEKVKEAVERLMHNAGKPE